MIKKHKITYSYNASGKCIQSSKCSFCGKKYSKITTKKHKDKITWTSCGDKSCEDFVKRRRGCESYANKKKQSNAH